MIKLSRWFGITTEKWCVDAVVSKQNWFKIVYKPVKPLVDTKAGEEYDRVTKMTVLWVLSKPMLILQTSGNLEPFVNPKESPFRKRV